MMQNSKRHFFLVFLLTAIFIGYSTIDASAQRRKKNKTEQTPADAIDKKQERIAKFDAEMEEKKERHYKKQTKKTRKRMKRNRKKSERYAKKGTSEPFFKRIFRKRHFK